MWPLQSGVSRQTSASWPLRTCSSLAATLENTIEPFRRPICWAATNMLVSPTWKGEISIRTEKISTNSILACISLHHSSPKNLGYLNSCNLLSSREIWILTLGTFGTLKSWQLLADGWKKTTLSYIFETFTCGNLSSHMTEFGTALRMLTHILSVGGSIL